jgi:BirA family biotin operon repressor/biotin-[acetyl-CoA-carboxylase] ligase
MNKIFTHQVHRFSVCDSTNIEAQKYITQNSCDVPRVFISGHQTLGRGQVRAKWLDMPDKNALFTVTMPANELPIRHLARWNMWFSSRIVHALRKQCKLPVMLKWPNDIMLYEKKIGGLLIETVLRGSQIRCIVAGCGINVGYAPEEVPYSDCLQQYANTSVDDIIVCVLNELDRKPFFADCVEEYHDVLIGYKQWRFYLRKGQKCYGSIELVDDVGNAQIRWKDTDECVAYGHKEVTWCYDENCSPNL